jgi:uncharacterized membrane protein
MRTLAASLAVLLLAAPTLAQTKRYSVDQIAVDALVVPDGGLDVQEDLAYRLVGSFSFAYREIIGAPSQITQVAVSENGTPYVPGGSRAKDPGTFEVAQHSGSTRITWYFQAKDATRTFHLSYRFTGAIRRHSDVAELYHKFVGDDWDRPIGAAHVTLRFPTTVPESDLRAWAHGPLNGTVTLADSAVHFDVAPLPRRTFWEGRVLFPPAIVSALAANDTAPQLSAILAEEQTFADQANADRRRQQQRSRDAATRAETRATLMRPFFAVSLGLVLAGLLVWVFAYSHYGRTHAVEVRAPSSEPPSNHPPAIVSYLMTRQVSAAAMVATLLDLAQRRILSIGETEQVSHGFFGEKTRTDYTFTVMRSLVDTARPFERNLIEFLLKEAGSDDTFSMSAIQKAAARHHSRFYKWFRGWGKEVREAAQSFDFFEPYNGGAIALVVLTGAAIALAGVLLSVLSVSPAGMPAILGGFVVACLATALRRRTPSGQRLFEEWSAFRHQLRGISQSMEQIDLPPQQWGQYVALAIVFGMHKRLLPHLRPQNASGDPVFPEWYSGYSTPGTSFAHQMSSFSTSMSAMVTSVSTSMSSAAGAGGGASAGGGGGSGGGGGGAG